MSVSRGLQTDGFCFKAPPSRQAQEAPALEALIFSKDVWKAFSNPPNLQRDTLPLALMQHSS